MDVQRRDSGSSIDGNRHAEPPHPTEFAQQASVQRRQTNNGGAPSGSAGTGAQAPGGGSRTALDSAVRGREGEGGGDGQQRDGQGDDHSLVLRLSRNSGRSDAAGVQSFAPSPGGPSKAGTQAITRQQTEALGVITQQMPSVAGTAGQQPDLPPANADAGGLVDGLRRVPQTSQGEVTGEHIGAPHSSGTQHAAVGWNARALGVNLLDLVENPKAHNFAKSILKHAMESAEHDARELMRDQSWVQGFWNKTTLAQDTSNAEAYRKKLQALTISNEKPTLVLDAIRDVANTIIKDMKELNVVTQQGMFVRDKLLKSAEQLKKSVHKTAFDNPESSQLATKALIIGANVGTILPFYVAMAGNPFGAYYLVALGNAYTRTLGLMAGLMRTSAADSRDVTSHFVQRHITWEAAPLAFVATTAARQYYVNQGKDDQAAYAQQVGENHALLAAVALVSFVLYVVPEFMSLTKKYYHKAASHVSDGSRLENRFDQGEMTLKGQQDLQKAIHGNLAAVTTLVSAVDEHRTSWNAAGGPAAAVENQMMSDMRQDLYNLVSVFSKVSDVAPEVGADDGQHAVATPASGGSGNKRAVAITMTSLGAAMGLVSSLSAIRTPALLADYASYYFSSAILVAARGAMRQYNAEDVANDFTSRFGGTTIGIPTVLPNTITLLGRGEGIFDLIRSGATEVAPPINATVPAFPGTKHPELHPASGALNFALGITYQFLTTAIYGTRAGPFFAKVLLQTIQGKGFRRALQSDPEAGATEMEDRNAARFADALIKHITDICTMLLEDRKKTMGEDPKDATAAFMEDQLQQHKEGLEADEEPGVAGPSKVSGAEGAPSSPVLRASLEAASPTGESAFDEAAVEREMARIRSGTEDVGKGKQAADPVQVQAEEDQIRQQALSNLRAFAMLEALSKSPEPSSNPSAQAGQNAAPDWRQPGQVGGAVERSQLMRRPVGPTTEQPVVPYTPPASSGELVADRPEAHRGDLHRRQPGGLEEASSSDPRSGASAPAALHPGAGG